MTAPPDTAPTDAELLATSVRDGDRFSTVYDRHYADIHRYVAGRLGPQAAEDVVAEVFLAAFRGRAAFDPARGSVRPWLYGIATNLIGQHRRTETRRYQALAQVPPDRHPDGHEDRVAASVSAERLQPSLARALAGLSGKDRDVVLLKALSQLTHEEIADVLGIPYGTVGSRLNRARRKLRAALPAPTEGL
ncbi:RNA polymerase sigma factor [Actinomadura logoneensis]|uniref:RNA polymerase sigma factor n=1 Tax=Actinomadura logoneensis TaxID=2293572 RepID=A0A372J9E8_9ACTN|nr:RNA polymerase sigma factor [Actinomadura logoneensis]RFU36631.1 RNA polymerase sigma factor [Actinomadura logoneensis]